MFLAFSLAFHATDPSSSEHSLPKRNYGFEKRQKELSKQRQKEEKKLRKLQRTKALTEEDPVDKAAPEPIPLEE
ncbi:MAG TPA: hypothetical protein VFS51_12460 [Gemmatimonadales bacterium]|nr:hypothetical protein [Gemmatimonadales bacterium]